MSSEISEGRQATFYIGTAMMVIGGLIFGVTFLSIISSSNQSLDSPNFGKMPNFAPIIIGWGLVAVGFFVRTLGARGLAGSGVILDPEEARSDLEPYSRMVGGMVSDALDQARVNLGGKSETVVKVKCRSCGGLNEENAKFCQSCGKPL